MKHLKYFEQASAYEAYKNGSDYILPNVSFVEGDTVVYYNPFVKETRVVCTYNVTDTTNATIVCNDSFGLPFTSMEVDGVLQDSVISEYTFDTVGEHTVKFELANPTSMMDAFYGCEGLTSIFIPDSVTEIGLSAFSFCYSLSEITCMTPTAPMIGRLAFNKVKEGGILKVPAGSDYSAWMNYLGTYNWTVEYI